MHSINGIGTSLYGKTDVEPDGSYIATKWFILFLLPIIPLGSYRVWRGETKATFFLPGASTSYRMFETKLHWKQIIRTYLAVWGLAVLLVIILFYISE